MKHKNGSRSHKETRVISSALELRKGQGDAPSKIVGYAAKFTPAMSEDLGYFREQIDPHAFDACLASNPDVRALWNHDANHILGRTRAGTLRLSVDKTGLLYEVDPPDTTFARDLMVSMERGDVTQSSFGFVCIEDTWREDGNGDLIRTVLKAEVFDVSPVTFPAYPDATSGVRALRTLPAHLRSKLSKRGDLGYVKGIDMLGITNGTSGTELDGTDDEDQDEDEQCSCACANCQADECDRCNTRDCRDENCDSCPMQDDQRSDKLRMRQLFAHRTA